MDHGARFARHEPLGGVDRPQAHRFDADLAALFDGDVDQAPNRRVAYEYGLAGANCLRGHYGAVEYEVRRSRHEDLVLCTGGLAFGAVRHDDRQSLLAGDGGKLERCRKARAATSAETRAIHQLYQRLARLRVRAPGRQRSMQLQMLRQIRRFPDGPPSPESWQTRWRFIKTSCRQAETIERLGSGHHQPLRA